MDEAEYVPTSQGARLWAQKLGAGASTIIVPNAVYMRRGFARLPQTHTVILYDLRNRGQSEAGDVHPEGVWGDVEDLEAIRAHFGVEKATLVGHSYLGLVVALYAMRHPERVSRLIQISPAQPVLGKSYAPPLSYTDEVLKDVWAGLQALETRRESTAPVEFCRQWWSLGRRLFVADEAHVECISDWGFCDLPNERNFMKLWVGNIVPSLQRLGLQQPDFLKVKCPVLTIHGTKDRSAPYGGGAEWAGRLPNAKLVTLEGVGHVPWVEAPELTWQAIEAFLTPAAGSTHP